VDSGAGAGVVGEVGLRFRNSSQKAPPFGKLRAGFLAQKTREKLATRREAMRQIRCAGDPSLRLKNGSAQDDVTLLCAAASWLDINALFAEEDDQAAWGECGAEVVASGDSIGEEEDGVVFEGAGIVQDVVFADVLLDFAVE
jgi:hypothetical protein